MVDPLPKGSLSSVRGDSRLRTLWSNFEAPFISSSGMPCTNGSMLCSVESPKDSFDGTDGDDDSILDRHAPQPHPPAHHQVRNFVDGLVTPFLNCVQPPLEACIAPAVERDYFVESRQRRSMHRGNIGEHFGSLPTTTSVSANSSVISKQYSVTTNCIDNSILSSRRKQELRETNVVKTQPDTAGFSRVNVNDVLCGRGNSISKHEGNLNFRDLIDANKGGYSKLTKKEKMMLARQIVDYVMNHTDPPGHFVARDSSSGLWYDIGLPRSLEKTSQALRESSAPAQGFAESTTCISYCVNSVASFEDDATDSIEIESAHREQSAKELSRAITIKMNNHRNAPVQLPLCIVPEHLQKVYRHERTVPPLPLPHPTSAFLNPPVPPFSPEIYMRHLLLHQCDAPPPALRSSQTSSLPHLDHRSDLLTNNAMRNVSGDLSGPPVVPPAMLGSFNTPPPTSPPCLDRRLTTTPTFPSSPPRRPLQQIPLAHAGVVVTPNGRISNEVELSFDTESAKVTQAPLNTMAKSGVESVFPLDIFDNPKYLREGEPGFGFPFASESRLPLGTSTVSPPREQKHSKRQRLSQVSLDASWDPSCVDFLDTSWDSANSSSSKRDGRKGATTQNLVEAIGSQLRLEDLPSPSEMLQSYAGGRRRNEPLPRPTKATSGLDTSVDSADGLAALSTAAFLRLDESF